MCSCLLKVDVSVLALACIFCNGNAGAAFVAAQAPLQWQMMHVEVPSRDAMQEEVGVGRRFTYNGGYFETRDTLKRGEGKWEGCPDLFGNGPGTEIFKLRHPC